MCILSLAHIRSSLKISTASLIGYFGGFDAPETSRISHTTFYYSVKHESDADKHTDRTAAPIPPASS